VRDVPDAGQGRELCVCVCVCVCVCSEWGRECSCLSTPLSCCARRAPAPGRSSARRVCTRNVCLSHEWQGACRRHRAASASAAAGAPVRPVVTCHLTPCWPSQDTLVTVLDANEGDFEKTMEMFKPINPAAKEEHQKRPASRAGPDDRPGRQSSAPRVSTIAPVRCCWTVRKRGLHLRVLPCVCVCACALHVCVCARTFVPLTRA